MKREEAIERLTDLVKTYVKFKDNLLYAKGDIEALTIAINDMKEMIKIKNDTYQINVKLKHGPVENGD